MTQDPAEETPHPHEDPADPDRAPGPPSTATSPLGIPDSLTVRSEAAAAVAGSLPQDATLWVSTLQRCELLAQELLVYTLAVARLEVGVERVFVLCGGVSELLDLIVN